MANKGGSYTQNNKSWELTPYEIQRKPQTVITDQTEIAISTRSLHNELMCPICLDMLRETQTTKECLHRFCCECITTALRSGNKECPTCRKKLVSRRSLRADPNFDNLIDKIYPDRKEYEAMQEQVLQKITIHHNQSALSNSIEEGLRSQALLRSQKMKKSDKAKVVDNNNTSSSHPQLQQAKIDNDKDNINGIDNKQTISLNNKREEDVPSSSHSSNGNSKKNHVESTGGTTSKPVRSLSESVQVELRPHPDQSGVKAELMVRKICTVWHASIHHVSSYLSLRISMEKNADAGATMNNADTNPDREPEFLLFTKRADDTNCYEELDNYGETLRDLFDKRSKRESRVLKIFYLKKA